jgi:hypothetical protein
MKVGIPVNTRAKVYLPSGDTSKIKESGININNPPDIEQKKLFCRYNLCT